MNVAELLTIMPHAGAQADLFVEPFNIAMERFRIDTPRRRALFLANVGHESLDLTKLVEDLRYSAGGLVRTWPTRFYMPPDAPRGRMDATLVAYNQPAIAGIAYGDRMGNRNAADGWEYRGRCPLMITGRDMYRRAGDGTGYNLLANPDLATDPMVGALVSGWVWAVEKNCNPLADAEDVEGVTKAINGGLIGLDDRRARYNRAIALV